MSIKSRIAELEKVSKINQIEYVVRIPDRNGDYPEKEEDIRRNRHVVLIVRGDDPPKHSM